jgi:hypothetical protein
VKEKIVIKTYRSRIPKVGGSVAALGFFMVGLGGVIPESHAGASGIVLSVFSLAFSLLLFVAVMTDRLVVSPKGIESWHTLRRKVIPWSSVRLFEVGGPRGLLPWPGLVVNSYTGYIRIDSIVGRRSFVDKVASELRAFQRDNVSTPIPRDGNQN